MDFSAFRRQDRGWQPQSANSTRLIWAQFLTKQNEGIVTRTVVVIIQKITEASKPGISTGNGPNTPPKTRIDAGGLTLHVSHRMVNSTTYVVWDLSNQSKQLEPVTN